LKNNVGSISKSLVFGCALPLINGPEEVSNRVFLSDYIKNYYFYGSEIIIKSLKVNEEEDGRICLLYHFWDPGEAAFR
jgi:hypothetical protein